MAKVTKKTKLSESELLESKLKNPGLKNNKDWSKLKAFAVFGLLIGLLSLIILVALERWVFNIIDFCNIIGVNQLTLFIPIYDIFYVIPDIAGMLLGFAGIAVSDVGRAWLIFCFNFIIYGLIAASYVKWGRQNKRWFWLIIAGICILIGILIFKYQ